MRAQEPDSDRVTVGPRAGRPAGTDATFRAGDIFNNDGLAERASHSLRQNPRDYICATARRQGHDHGDRARRISLRRCTA